MEAEENIMPFLSHLSPWMPYQRHSDSAKVRARIVQQDEEKLMQVEEPLSEEVRCPECKYLLEERNERTTRTYLLATWRFHKTHRLLDKPKK